MEAVAVGAAEVIMSLLCQTFLWGKLSCWRGVRWELRIGSKIIFGKVQNSQLASLVRSDFLWTGLAQINALNHPNPFSPRHLLDFIIELLCYDCLSQNSSGNFRWRARSRHANDSRSFFSNFQLPREFKNTEKTDKKIIFMEEKKSSAPPLPPKPNRQ